MEVFKWMVDLLYIKCRLVYLTQCRCFSDLQITTRADRNRNIGETFMKTASLSPDESIPERHQIVE